jgi:hypothetical protein
MLEAGKTSSGEPIDELPIDEQLAAIADGLVSEQWRSSSPWWGEYVPANRSANQPGVDRTEELVFAELRLRTYEYLKACLDAGLLEHP